eukprot:COSAG06_NODE_185_length_20838_cov_50.259463_6_plen_103_part_00
MGPSLRCAPVRRDSRRAAAARVLSIVVRVVEVGEEAVCLWRARVSGVVAVSLELSLVRWLRVLLGQTSKLLLLVRIFPPTSNCKKGQFWAEYRYVQTAFTCD